MAVIQLRYFQRGFARRVSARAVQPQAKRRSRIVRRSSTSAQSSTDRSVSGSRASSTSFISEDATIEDGVEIGPYCVIGPSVVIGSGTKLHGHNCILGNVTIGERNTFLNGATVGSEEDGGDVIIGHGNRFGHFCTVGVRCADMKYNPEDPGHLKIGNQNDIREYVGIHCSSSGSTLTEIGDQNLLMGTVHIGHDSKLGNQNIIANGSMLAGHVVLGNRVVVGGACAIAQRCWVGSFSMLGGGSMVVMDVPPYVRVQGDRAKIRGLNVVQFARSGFSEDEKAALSRCYKDLWLSRKSGPIRSIGEKLDDIVEGKKYEDSVHCQHLIDFINDSVNTTSNLRSKSMCSPLKLE